MSKKSLHSRTRRNYLLGTFVLTLDSDVVRIITFHRTDNIIPSFRYAVSMSFSYCIQNEAFVSLYELKDNMHELWSTND